MIKRLTIERTPALTYNGLVLSWPEIVRVAKEGGKPQKEQTEMALEE